MVGAGAELPKVKAGVVTWDAVVGPPKVGPDDATSFSLSRLRLLRSSSVSSLFIMLPRGTTPVSVDKADGALKLKVAAVVGAAGAGLPPKLKPVEEFVAVPPLLPNEKTGLFADSTFRSDLLMFDIGKVKLLPLAGPALSAGSVPGIGNCGFLGELEDDE